MFVVKIRPPPNNSVIGALLEQFPHNCLFGCYTHNSHSAALLFEKLTNLKLSKEYVGKKTVFCMGANAHNEDWLASNKTDSADEKAQAFSGIFDIEQYAILGGCDFGSCIFRFGV